MTGLGNTLKYLICIVVWIGLSASSVFGASVSMTVAQQSVAKGDTFVVEWYLNTEQQSVNVVDATLFYSPETLEVVDTITGSSALTLWIETPRVVEPGVVTFVGGIPAGIKGSSIPLMRTLFRATATGNASIALGTDARVVLSDGVATTESLTMSPVVFPITPAKTRIITSSTHPDQHIWYRDTTLRISINEKNPIVYSLSANADITPIGEPVVVSEPITYENLADGMYYFKIAAPVAGQLQELETFRVYIDRTAPEVGSVVVDLQSELYNNTPTLNFYAVDKTSGIAYTKVKTGWFGRYHDATSPHKLRRPLFGSTAKLLIKDKAGNSTLSTVYYRGYLGIVGSYCVTLGVLICIVIIAVRKRQRIRTIIKNISSHFSSR